MVLVVQFFDYFLNFSLKKLFFCCNTLKYSRNDKDRSKELSFWRYYMDKTLIARRIRQYRHLQKLSQEDLADLAGLSDTYIRKLEAGLRTPSLDTILVLAATLNTTPDRLLLPTSGLNKSAGSSIMDLLNDCTPTEFVILYENMAELKELLRTHIK